MAALLYSEVLFGLLMVHVSRFALFFSPSDCSVSSEINFLISCWVYDLSGHTTVVG